MADGISRNRCPVLAVSVGTLIVGSVGEPDSVFCKNAMLDPEFVLGTNGEVVPEHQIVVLVDAPTQGVFNWQAAIVDLHGGNGTETGFKVGFSNGHDVVPEEFPR